MPPAPVRLTGRVLARPRPRTIAAQLVLLVVGLLFPLAAVGTGVAAVTRRDIDGQAAAVFAARARKELALRSQGFLLAQNAATLGMLLQPEAFAEQAAVRIAAYDSNVVTLPGTTPASLLGKPYDPGALGEAIERTVLAHWGSNHGRS